MDTADTFFLSPSELARLQGSAEAPLLLDVRKPPAFAAGAHMLAGAVRCEPDAVAAFAASQPRRPVVTYCVYGHGVSQAAAKVLRDAGWDARWLAGGIEGGQPGVDAPEDIARWRAAAPARVAKPA